MAWNETLTVLNYVLAGLYPFVEDSYRIVDAAEIPKIHVAFQRKGIDNWYQILLQADARNKVAKVIEAVLNDFPDHPILIQAARGDLAKLKGPIIDKDVKWKGDLSADTVERIMGKQSSFLPVSFLEVGLQRARSVARVKLIDGYGSGFLTIDNIFITNHHVLRDKLEAESATIQFNYQQTARGLDLEPINYRLDPDSGFKTSSEDDWTLVRVRGDANADWGAIEIEQADVSKTERVNIIQHPHGGPKQIALYHNIVAYADDTRVQYLTDTLPGSSGSPVFDDTWRVISLHHSGGWILEPGTKKEVFRNEGININRIAIALEQGEL
jgi:V8-like Glu-specific endopeptidase